MRTDRFNETEEGYSVCAIADINAADSLKVRVMEDCMAVGKVCALCNHRIDVIRNWFAAKAKKMALAEEGCKQSN